MTPLMLAVMNMSEQTDTVKALINAGANVDLKGKVTRGLQGRGGVSAYRRMHACACVIIGICSCGVHTHK